jgi:hypothetical protein
MPTLVSKVREITKSSSDVTNNQSVIDYLSSGAQYVISGLPSHMLHIAATDTTVTSGSGVTLAGNGRLLGVRLGQVECMEIPVTESYVYNILLTASPIDEATTQFPVYYTQAGKIYIKPNPSGSYHGVVTFAQTPTITSNTSTWAFQEFESIPIKYAASLDAKAMSNYFMEKTSSSVSTVSMTNIEDALTKAQNLIDNLGSTDFESYIDDEDSEMAQVVVQGASQEVNRASQEINKEMLRTRLSEQYNILSTRYNEISNVLYKEASDELDRLISSNDKMIMMQLAKGQQQGGNQ